MIRRIGLCSILMFSCLPGMAQSTSPVLSDDIKRQILSQLWELSGARQQITVYNDFIQREKDQDQKERDNWQRSLDLEKQATALAQKATDLQTERANLYQSLYNTVKKKPGGFGHVLKKIFSLGLAR